MIDIMIEIVDVMAVASVAIEIVAGAEVENEIVIENVTEIESVIEIENVTDIETRIETEIVMEKMAIRIEVIENMTKVRRS